MVAKSGPKAAWTDVVAAKRATRDELVKKHLARSNVSPLAANIAKIDNIRALTQLLEKGEVSAEDVMSVYITK